MRHRIPRLETELITVTQGNHQCHAQLLPHQSSFLSYMPHDILCSLTERKAGAKTKQQ